MSINRRQFLAGTTAATAAAATSLFRTDVCTCLAAADERLIIDTHLEVWTLDPKFPFNHPEAGRKLNVEMAAPIENQVEQMRDFAIRYAVLITAVVAAALAPTPDWTTLFMFWIPMVGLYGVSILLSWLVYLKKNRARKRAELYP